MLVGNKVDYASQGFIQDILLLGKGGGEGGGKRGRGGMFGMPEIISGSAHFNKSNIL